MYRTIYELLHMHQPLYHMIVNCDHALCYSPIASDTCGYIQLFLFFQIITSVDVSVLCLVHSYIIRVLGREPQTNSRVLNSGP